jgi:hypothetical protein
MPARINMFLSNGSVISPQLQRQINQANISTVQPTSLRSSLNSPIIGRIHNTKPGCNSCGRH